MKKGANQLVIKVKNIAEVVKSKDATENMIFIYLHAGEGFYLVDGIRVPEKEFNTNNQAVELQPVNFKGANPDLKKNFINNIKSY